MTIATDDFERANGPLGSNWTTLAGSPTIAGGYAGGPSVCSAYYNALSDTGRMTASITALYTLNAALNDAVILKYRASDGAYYRFRVLQSGSNHVYYLDRWGGVSYSAIASATAAGAAINYYTLTLRWDNGHLSGYFNGALVVEGDDTNINDGAYAGWITQSTGNTIASFATYTGADLSLSVNPSPIGNYGSCVTLTLSGTGTAWTPGTPGSPSFTVDHGAITAQTVNSATAATLTYCPGTFLGTATFGDPSTGLTVSALVTSDPAIVPPTAADPWMADDGVLATATTQLFDPDYILTDQSPIIESTEEIPGRLPILTAIEQIWHAHFGEWTGSAPPDAGVFKQLLEVLTGEDNPTVVAFESEVNHSLREDLEAILTALGTLITSNHWTLGDVIVQLAGEGVKTHLDLYNAITAIEGGSNQDVLDALTAYFGEDPPTIAQLGTMIGDLASIAGYSLADVKGWIEAIPTDPITSLQPVLDRLDDIQPSGSNTLATIEGAIVPSSAIQAIVEAGTLALAGEEGATIAAVLDAIAALDTGEAAPHAPVWPGIESVTLGTPVELTSQLYLEEPCDGVIVAVTTPPTRTGLRQIGGALYDYGVGEIAFETDNGDIEPWQYLGFRAAIFTPKTMARAAAVRFRVLAGAEGTVTPWTSS